MHNRTRIRTKSKTFVLSEKLFKSFKVNIGERGKNYWFAGEFPYFNFLIMVM